jgi:protein Tex
MELTESAIAELKVDEVAIMDKIASELAIRTSQVSAVISLVNEGCTVPFISRYRKERTGSLDEVQVRDSAHKFETYLALEERRLEVIRGIFALGKLDEALYVNLRKATTLSEIEDIWTPFKKKKKTRGMLALERGLGPLADIMASSDETAVDEAAPKFVREIPETPELGVPTARDAVQGAMDILAERLSQDPDNRTAVKRFYVSGGALKVKGSGDEAKKASSTYQMYWDYSEPLSSLKSHRVLAINRGEREGELEVSLSVDEDGAVALLRERIRTFNRYHFEAIDDGLRRLLGPAVLREIRTEASDLADGHGIDVFSQNLRNLLMQPPIKGTRVLGMDPGIRTGTKCVALDETGKFLDYFLINQERDAEGAKKAIADAVRKHSLALIAVGNGTASHETQEVVAAAISEGGLSCEFTVVDEDGASVYSASDVARDEFPELDLTVRGAISIGRRLQDPLAELVKIDPKSIGVGLYQHDVNQKRLSDTLDEVVGSVVNNVGVNLNTASASLLKYVSGINTGTAKKIVKYRESNGKITARDQLKLIPGMGDKTFEQCAGFLKIPESANALDNTWVHPENYPLAEELLGLVRSGSEPAAEARKALKEKYGVGDTTIGDIVAEIKKPNRDPREGFPKPVLQKGVIRFEDLVEGMKVTGKVKNVVDFGAFVEIGIKESALIHVSELSDRFVKDPMEVLKVGDVREFRIISIDPARKRIGLSLKSGDSRPSARDGATGSQEQRRETVSAGGSGPRRVVAARKPISAAARPAQPRPVKSYDHPSEPRREKEDDGMTYNPFADLLKNRKK